MITETDDVEQALDEAALAWPELGGDRADLLRRLISEGAAVAHGARAERLADRRAAIHDTSGMFTGMWPADVTQRMRDEWPE
jgi:hypothetical protein